MKTCPKCGGKNLQAAAMCRLCATPIAEPEPPPEIDSDMTLSDQLSPTLIISGPGPGNQSEPPSAEAEQVTCPACQALNEPDWLFCDQCGKSLSGPAAGPPQPSASPQEAITERPRAGAFKEARANITVSSEPERASPPSTPAAVAAQGQSEHTGYTTSLVCGGCGVVQPSGGMYCHSCGAALTVGAITKTKQSEPKKRTAVLRLIAEGGESGEAFSLNRSETVIGRAQGHLTFEHDGFMSGRHARIVERDGRYFLIDENSRNGTFVRIRGEAELKSGDVFLVGKQVLKFNQS